MQNSLALIVAALIASHGQGDNKVSNIPNENQINAVGQDLNAMGVAKALRESGLPVTDIVVVTEETDANNLLGRPGQYVSKAFFVDRRYTGQGQPPEKQNTIETFASEKDATRRREYIERVTASMPLFTQYIIQSGKVLLRLDKSLKPSEAREYEAAL